MKWLLALLAVISFFIGGMTILASQTVLYGIIGFQILLISAVLLCGAAIVGTIRAHESRMEQLLTFLANRLQSKSNAE